MSSLEDAAAVALTTTVFYVLHSPAHPADRVRVRGDAVPLVRAPPLATCRLNEALWSITVALPAKRRVNFAFGVERGDAGGTVWERETRWCVPRGVEFHVSSGHIALPELPPTVWDEHDVVRAGETQVRLMVGGVTSPHQAQCVAADGALLPVLCLRGGASVPADAQLEVRSGVAGEPVHRVSLAHLGEKQVDVVYHTRRDLLDVQLELRLCAGDGRVLGRAFVLGGAMRGGSGFLHLALVGDEMAVVGDATLYFVVVRGYRSPLERGIKRAVVASAEQVARCTASTVARSLWKSSPSEDVGHRGSGAHGARGSSSRTWLAENTILSFNNAARNNLPFIEFDVQLTRDSVPVIWHDFHINDNNNLPLQIYDLTLKQFRNFRKHEQALPPALQATARRRHQSARHAANSLAASRLAKAGKQSAPQPAAPSEAASSSSIARPATSALVLLENDEFLVLEQKRDAASGSVSRSSSSDCEPDSNGANTSPAGLRRNSGRRSTVAADDQTIRRSESHGIVIADSLTSLRDVFEYTPETLGFDIELKYPLLEDARAGVRFPGRNDFVDAVLNIVFAYSEQPRRIFFSSFDPDTCLMLHLKQTLYPVFFLTEGGTLGRNALDVRTASLEGAVRFARRRNFFGVISRATPLLKDVALIDFVKTSGLLLGTFGGENNELENVQTQERKRVDLIVSDHIATNEARKSEMRERAERFKNDSVFV